MECSDRTYHYDEELFPGHKQCTTFTYKIVKENGSIVEAWNLSDKVSVDIFLWLCKRKHWHVKALFITVSDENHHIYNNPLF